MSARAMIWAGEVDGLTSTTKLVLIALANRASDRGTSCFPSIPTIAAWCRLGDRAVQRAIQTLEKEGYISVERRARTSHNFTLLMNLKIVAERSKPAAEVVSEMPAGVSEVPEPGVFATPYTVNQPVTYPKERTPIIPIGSQALPGLELPPNLLGSPKPAATKAAPTKAQADALIETWNAICGRVKKATRVNDARRALVMKRFKEEFNSDAGEWEKFCKRCARSPFLTGDNDRNWRPPTFDWMMKPEKIMNVFEGVYDDKSGNQGSSAPRRFIPSPGTI